MVNIQNILQEIRSYREIGNDQKAELELLIRQYPWFSTLHLLLAKSYKNIDSKLFEGALKKAALHAGDRSVLYDFMHNQLELNLSEISPEPLKEEESVDYQIPLQETFDETDINLKSVEPADQENSGEYLLAVIESVKSEIQELGNLVNHDNEDEVQIQEEIDLNSETNEETELESPEKEHVLPSELLNIESDESLPVEDENADEINTSEPDDTLEEIAIIVDAKSEKWKESEIPNQVERDDDAEEEDDIPVVDLNKSVYPRFKVLYDPLEALKSNEEPLESEEKSQPIVIPQVMYDPEKELLSKEIKTEEEPKDFGFWLDHFADDVEPVETEAQNQNPDALDLLNKFLENRPSISRPKAEFFKPENMARKSEEFHLDLVTESLAQILAKQGHKQKAIEVYEKLMLQNPNNSAFFAAQIEKLRTE